MSDIKIFRDGTEVDIELDQLGLVEDESLENAVLVSLFTDKRHNGENGWWADMLSTDGDEIGSKLWILGREKMVQETLYKYRDEVQDALKWMVDDGVAKEINVDVNAITLYEISITVDIIKQDDDVIKYQLAWNGQSIK